VGRRQVCEEARVLTPVRLPLSLARRLRRLATDRRVSVNALVTEAVEQFLSGPSESGRGGGPPGAQTIPGPALEGVPGGRP
jgi:hypothetical protein